MISSSKAMRNNVMYLYVWLVVFVSVTANSYFLHGASEKFLLNVLEQSNSERTFYHVNSNPQCGENCTPYVPRYSAHIGYGSECNPQRLNANSCFIFGNKNSRKLHTRDVTGSINRTIENTFFVSAWVNPSGSRKDNSCGTLFDFSYEARREKQIVHTTYNYFGLYFPTCDSVAVYTDGETRSTKSIAPLNQDNWNHILFDYNGITGTFTLYVNGTKVSSAENIPALTNLFERDGFSYTIGYRRIGSDKIDLKFVGAMDQITMKAGPVTAELAESLFEEHVTPDDSNLCRNGRCRALRAQSSIISVSPSIGAANVAVNLKILIGRSLAQIGGPGATYYCKYGSLSPFAATAAVVTGSSVMVTCQNFISSARSATSLQVYRDASTDVDVGQGPVDYVTLDTLVLAYYKQAVVRYKSSNMAYAAPIYVLANSASVNADLRCHVTIPPGGSLFKGVVPTTISNGLITCNMTGLGAITSTNVAEVRVSYYDTTNFPNLYYSGSLPLTTTFIPDTEYTLTNPQQKIVGNITSSISFTLSNAALNLDSTNAGYVYLVLVNATTYELVSLTASNSNRVFTASYNFQNIGAYTLCLYIEASYPRRTAVDPAGFEGGTWTPGNMRYVMFGTSCVGIYANPGQPVDTIVPESIPTGTTVPVTVITNSFVASYSNMYSMPWTATGFLPASDSGGTPSGGKPLTTWSDGCTVDPTTGIYIANALYAPSTSYGLYGQSLSTSDMVFTVTNTFDQFSAVFGVQNDYCNTCSGSQYQGQFVNFYVLANNTIIGGPYQVELGKFGVSNTRSVVLPVPDYTTSITLRVQYLGSSACGRVVVGAPKLRKKPSSANFADAIAYYGSAIPSSLRCNIQGKSSLATWDGFNGFTCNINANTVGSSELIINGTASDGVAITVLSGYYYNTFSAPSSLDLSTVQGNIVAIENTAMQFYFVPTPALPTNIRSRIKCAITTGTETLLTSTYNPSDGSYSCTIPAYPAGANIDVALKYDYSGKSFFVSTTKTISVMGTGPLSYKLDGPALVDSGSVTDATTIYLTTPAYLPALLDNTGRMGCYTGFPSTITTNGYRNGLLFQCTFIFPSIGIANVGFYVNIAATGTNNIIVTTNTVKVYSTPKLSLYADILGTNLLPTFNIANNPTSFTMEASITPLNNLIATGNNELNYTCVYGTNVYPATLVSVISSVAKWSCLNFSASSDMQTVMIKMKTPLGVDSVVIRSISPYYTINQTLWSLTVPSSKFSFTYFTSYTVNVSSTLNIAPTTSIASKIMCKLAGANLKSTVYTSPPNVLMSCTLPQQSIGDKSVDIVYSEGGVEFVISSTPIIITYTSVYNISYVSQTNTFLTTDNATVASVSIGIDSFIDSSLVSKVRCNFTQPDATFALVAPSSAVLSGFYIFTCAVPASNPSNAGVGFLSLSLDQGGGYSYSISSNSLPVVLVQKIAITQVVPFSTLISLQNTTVRLQTSAVNPYKTYVSYACTYQLLSGSQSNSIVATYDSVQRTYTCNITSPGVSFASAITLYAISTFGSNVTLSTSPIAFYFMQQASVTSYTPFILPYTAQQTNFDVYFTLSTPLPTVYNVYCNIRAVGDNSSYNSPVLLNTTTGGVYCNVAKQPSVSSVPGSMTTLNIGVFVYDSPVYSIMSVAIGVQLLIAPSFVNELQALNVTDLNSTLSLSFIVPDDPLLSFKLQYSFGSGVQTLPCNFTVGTKPTCVFGPLIDPINLPQKMSTFLVVDRAQNNTVTATVPGRDLFYIGNISIYASLPWVADTATYRSSNVTSKFTYSGPQLDSNFKYECISSDSSGTLISSVTNVVASSFKCDVKGPLVDETVSVSLRITSFVPSLVSAALFTLPTSVISIASGEVEFTTLALSPTINNFQPGTVHTVTRSSTGAPYVIPTQYQSYVLQMVLNDGATDVWTCASVSNNIQCTSQTLSVDSKSSFFPSGVTADMNTVPTYLTTLDGGLQVTVMNVAQPLLYFRTATVQTSLTKAALRGTNVTTNFKFSASTFRFGSALGTKTISCGSYYNATWTGSVIAVDRLACTIIYDATQLDDNQVLYYKPLLNVPVVLGPQFVSLLDPSSVNGVLYYLDQKAINFTSPSQTQVFYIGQNAIVTITMQQANIPQELIESGFIVCSISTNNPTKVTATLVSNLGGDYTFACNAILTDAVTGSGSRTIGISFFDGVGYFDISANRLEVIYVKKSGIISLQPLAVPVSSTTKTTVSVGTSFPTASYTYGSSMFYCETGPRFGSSILLNATITADGVFACVFNNTISETWDINVVIYAKGMSLPLLSPNASLTFVDKFFLSPSYGLVQGNELTYMDPYDRPSGLTQDEAHRIRFKNNGTLSNYNFTCVDAIGTDGAPALNCTTIPLDFLPSFTSNFMSIGQNNSLAMKWIIYESRTVNVVPNVFPIGTSSVNVTLKMNSVIPTVPEGYFQAVVAYGSSDVVRYDMGNTLNINNTVTISTMSRGSYSIAGYYYSPFLFELYGTIKITNIQRLHFVLQDEILYPPSNFTNIGFTNAPLITQVQLADTVLLQSEVYSDTYCVFTTSSGTVTNYRAKHIGVNSNLFECTISYASAASGQLSLAYIDSAKAFNGQVLLSSNTLGIAFVEPLFISTSSPLATLTPDASTPTNITITTNAPTTFQATTADPYNGAIHYYCRYYNNPMTNTSIITYPIATKLSHTTYSCSVVRGSAKDENKDISIELWVSHNDTAGRYVQLQYSGSAPALFLFMTRTATTSIIPFMTTYTVIPSGVNVTIVTEKDIISQEQLYCMYTSDVDGTIFSKASFANINDARSRSIKCQISKQYVNDVILSSLVTVSLVFRASRNSVLPYTAMQGEDFVLSTNTLPFVYVKDQIAFDPIATSDVFSGSQNGFLHWNEYGGKYVKVNFTTPNVTTLSYNITMSSALKTYTMDCLFAKNARASCIFTQVPFNTIPTTLSFTLTIYDRLSGGSETIPIKPIMYYETQTIQTIFPFMLSYTQSIGAAPAVPLYTTISKQFNSNDYNLYCKISRKVGSPTYITAIFNSTTTFYCPIKSFGIAENLTVSIYFSPSNNQNSYYSNRDGYAITSSNVTLVSNNATIYVIAPSDVMLSNSQALISNSTSITIPLVAPPTQSYAKYSMQLVIKDRGRSTPCSCDQPLTTDNSTWKLTCRTPVYDSSTFPSLPWRVSIDLLINNVFAITTLPQFTYYQTSISTVNVLPIKYIPEAVTPRSLSKIIFNSTMNWVPKLNTATVKYGCTDCTAVDSSVYSCWYLNAYQLQCPSPQFKLTNATASQLALDIQISFNGVEYQPLPSNTVIVYSTRTISVASVTGSNCRADTTSSFRIVGNNFFTSNSGEANNIVVIVHDAYISVQVAGIFVNSGAIDVTIPAFWYKKVIFPRSFFVSVSLDGGQYFFTTTNPLFTCNPIPTVTISGPTLLPVSEFLNGLNVTNLPDLYTPLVGSQKKSLLLQLESDTDTIVLLENSGTYSTKSVAMPATPQTMSLVLYLVISDVNGTVSTTRAYVPTQGSVTLYKPPVLTLETPTVLMVGSTLPIVIGTGDTIPSNLANLIQANFVTSGSRRVQAIMPLTFTQTSDHLYLYINNATLNNNTVGMSLQVTFNGGYHWQTLASTFSTMGNYYLSSITNEQDGDQPTTYTFQTTLLSVFGRFPSTAITNLRLRTTLSETYAILQPNTIALNWLTSDQFSIIMPNITVALPFIDQSQARFPLTTYLGVTFNGYDYAEIELIWLNTYRQPLITLVNPQAVPRFSYQLFCQGVYLSNINNCVFRNSAQNQTERTPVIYPGNGTSFYCDVPNNYTVSGWQLTVSNEQTESGTPFQITLYDPPKLLYTDPASGTTQGGYQVTLYVANYTQGLTLYLRVASTYIQEPCITYDTSSDIAVFTCTMTSHDQGTFPLYISYNQIHYYSYGGLLRNESDAYPSFKTGAPGTFSFSGCGAGYTADDFSKNCTACPVGTYKPSAGTYECIQCPNNTYSDTPGQSSCTSCPLFTSTLGQGANTSYACVCTPGYYSNRDFVANYFNTSVDYFTSNTTLFNKRCTICPPGGSCPTYNMTYPLAAYGYWNANYTGPGNDRFVFFKCFPAEACPGGGPENCTFGYQGTNCGLCLNDPRSTQTQFYKWQYKCQQCQEGTWWRLILFLLLIAGITIIFFIFSSIKITHLSSISIAFSFWQIISMFSHFDIQWPLAVSNTFTAASVTNFNTDFLSPQCIIPQMSWQTKWVIQTVLPFVFGVAFLTLYILGEIRSFILNRVGHLVPFKYWAFYEPQPIDELEETKYTTSKQRYWQLIKFFLGDLLLIVKNMLVWLRNFCVWFIKQGLTRHQMQTFRNKCINSYTAFLSFTFIFIMTQASEIFVCTQQPNGQFTLNNSPDIFCYGDASNGGWNYMLPATIIIYIFFGLGSLLFFVYVFIEKKRLMYGNEKIKKMRNRVEETSEMIKKENNIVGDVELDELHELEFGQDLLVKMNKLEKYEKSIHNAEKNFRERYRFLLLRFKRRLFYWEAVITARKLALSLLYTFLKPVQVVVFGIFVVFLALVLHFNFVPFRQVCYNFRTKLTFQKFHNLIEYIVLLSTLIILFMGFLFFVNSFPADWLRTASVVITVGIIVACSALIVLMVLIDLWTRRQKEQQKIREYRKRMEEEFGKNAAASLKKQYKSLFPSALSKMNRVVVDEEDDPNDPWTVEENPLMMGTEDPTYDIEYVHDEEDPWTITENGLIEKPVDASIDEGEWIIIPNLLATDDKGESVYAGMSTRLVRVEFDLPFYASEEDDSGEDESNNMNDVFGSLFKKERAKKRIVVAKDKIVSVVQRFKKIRAKEEQISLLDAQTTV